MLTNNLPKSNDTEQTWSWIKIYIENHVPLHTDGELKCYFHNYYPCSFVSWEVDTSGYPTRTKIVLKTPTNIDFRRSNIPLTITTEGGIGNDEGFTIDPVIQRYKIYCWFYTFQTPTVSPRTNTDDVANVDFTNTQG